MKLGFDYKLWLCVVIALGLMAWMVIGYNANQNQVERDTEDFVRCIRIASVEDCE